MGGAAGAQLCGQRGEWWRRRQRDGVGSCVAPHLQQCRQVLRGRLAAFSVGVLGCLGGSILAVQRVESCQAGQASTLPGECWSAGGASVESFAGSAEGCEAYQVSNLSEERSSGPTHKEARCVLLNALPGMWALNIMTYMWRRPALRFYKACPALP